jgi:hypothetical protein
MRAVKRVNRISGSGTTISKYEKIKFREGLGRWSPSIMKVRPAGTGSAAMPAQAAF